MRKEAGGPNLELNLQKPNADQQLHQQQLQLHQKPEPPPPCLDKRHNQHKTFNRKTERIKTLKHLIRKHTNILNIKLLKEKKKKSQKTSMCHSGQKPRLQPSDRRLIGPQDTSARRPSWNKKTTDLQIVDQPVKQKKTSVSEGSRKRRKVMGGSLFSPENRK